MQRVNNVGKGRVLVPRGGGLFASYEVSAGTGTPVDVRRALDSVLDANNLNPFGARFRVQQAEQAQHVIPTQARSTSAMFY